MIIEIPVPTIVAEGTKVNGDLTFFSGTQIFGVVEGSIFQQSLEPLQIGRCGWIHGDIQSEGPVIVEGRVEGSIRSDVRIVLTASAAVNGQLSGPRITVQPGALLDGEVKMGTKKPETQPLTPAKSEAA